MSFVNVNQNSSGILLSSNNSSSGIRVADQSLATTKRIQRQKTSVEDKVSRLEKYEELDKNHPLNRPFQGSSSFRGPVFKRKYTNLMFIFLFFIANGAFLFYGTLVYKDGSEGRLTKGMDFRAEICGVNKLKARKFLYYANPAIDLNVKFCVESCPSTAGQKICLYDVDPKVLTPFCYTQSATTATGLFCLPNEPINRKIVDNDLSEFSNLIKRIAGDLGSSFDIVVASLLVSFIMAALFLRAMFDPKKIKFIVWGCIWGTVFGLILLAVFFYKEYLDAIEVRCIQKIDKRDCGGFRALIFRVASYVCLGIDLVYFFFVMKFFNKINLGVGVLQATTRCSVVFNQLKVVPFGLSVVLILVGAFFVFSAVLGFSVGEIIVIPAKNIDGGYVKTIVYSNMMRYLVGISFFIFQWWINVILLISDTILSYSLSVWYFEKRKESLILPSYNIIKAVLKYHLGTIIMLGLFKIVFRPFRLTMSLLTAIMKRPKQHLNIVRFMQACCLCCIHLHERALRYQSKAAVVQTAMWSESFSTASKRAWFLVFRNKHKYRNLDLLCTSILFLTKINCALVGSLFAYGYITFIPKAPFGNNTAEIETPLGPTALVFYLGFFFASLFQSALDIANKTLLQCFLMDEEMFVGEQRFASKDVLAFMEYYKVDDGDKTKFGKLQQYVKGMKATLDANVPLVNEIDVDDEENKKMQKKKKNSDESQEEEEEEEDQSPQPQQPAKGSDESSSEEESSEEDESEEEEDDDNKSDLFKAGMFGGQTAQPNHQTFNVEFGKMNTVNSLQTSAVQVGANHTKGNLSAFGKTAFSIEKVDESRDLGKSRDSPFRISGNNFKNNDVSMSDDGSVLFKAQSQTQLIKKPSAPNNKDKSSMLFGEWNDLHSELDGKSPGVKPADAWRPLETSGLSSGSSHSRRPLGKRGDTSANESRINLADASAMTTTKIVEKSHVNNNNTMKSDKHNVFNKSKIQQSTMRFDYDDDDEDNSKYRL